MSSMAEDVTLDGGDVTEASPLSLAAEELRDRFVGSYRNSSTAASCARAVNRWFTWCADAGVDPLAATTNHVKVWVRVEKNTPITDRRGFIGNLPSPATVVVMVSAVRQFYSYAMGMGVLAENPVPSRRVLGLSPQRPSREELARVMARGRLKWLP